MHIYNLEFIVKCLKGILAALERELQIKKDVVTKDMKDVNISST